MHNTSEVFHSVLQQILLSIGLLKSKEVENDVLITIQPYTTADHPALLKLLLELQSTYFLENASPQLYELEHLHNIKNTYSKYLDLIEKSESGLWQIFLAKPEINEAIGFIIGRIERDDDLILNKVGIVEDWYVQSSFRRQGIGLNLYNQLERWFKEKGCHQVQSDTWQGNTLSIKAHEQAGFFISGIKFRKKIAAT